MSAGTVGSLTTVLASLSVMRMFSALTPESKGSSLPGISQSISWELCHSSSVHLYEDDFLWAARPVLRDLLAPLLLVCLMHPSLLTLALVPTAQWPPGVCLPAPLKTP